MARFDIAVIGSGPGGYVAALRAAQLGKAVCVVERDALGGVCLNRGCIPTKALLHSSQTVADLAQAADHGITVDNLKIDLARMIERKNGVVKKLRSGITGLLKARKVDVHQGRAKLVDATSVQVTDGSGGVATIQAENIVIATGSEPIVPGFFPQDRSRIMTSDEILDLTELPESLLIVGGGVIGCEFATLFSELGVKVTIVEMLERLLPMADPDISKALTKSFQGQGIELHIPAMVEKMEISGSGVTTTIKEGATIETKLALVCTGRRPLTDDLGLEEVGVATEKGFITVDDYCCTSVPNIYAIGDVTGKWQLAHVASRQADCAASNILGAEDHEDYSIVPSAVYTHPEIAWVGLTAEEAKAQHGEVRTATFPMMASGLALAYQSTNGFAKITVGENDEILGAYVMCPHASDLIQEVAVLMKSECTLHELAATIHGHPTFAESLAETADILLGKPLHSH